MRPRLLAALVGLLLLAAPAAALGAAPPRASLPDVEDEVMCTQCGTALNIADAPVADRERRFIRGLIAQGRNKEQIKAALEAEYGPRVLAVPSQGGFDAAAWLVPALLGVLGLLGIAVAARRWHGGAGEADAGNTVAAGPALDPEQSRRLDSELAAFDR